MIHNILTSSVRSDPDILKQLVKPLFLHRIRNERELSIEFYAKTIRNILDFDEVYNSLYHITIL